ncbi:MAG TPA: ATP-binding protein [Planctomycetota bacterium]|nr:ATP-binding protein [Planctomycetota bacterium]
MQTAYPEGRPRPWLAGAGLLLVGAVLVLDVLAPIEIAVGVLYVLPVLLGLWVMQAAYLPVVTGLAVVLTLLDPLFVPDSQRTSAVLAGRSLSLVAIVCSALVVLAFRRSQRQLDQRRQAQVAAQSALQRSLRETRDFKDALDVSSIVATTDARGRITYANDNFCRISRYSREELLGQDHRLVNSGHHAKDFIRELWDTIGSGRVWKGEICNRAKDGTIYWVDTTIVPFLDEGGRPYQYLAIRNDITERKRAEQALLEQRALVRLGEMAAVVAHEVKNPLAGIGGAIQIIRDRMPPASPDREIVKAILDRIAALNGTVQDLLLFARPRLPQLRECQLDGLLAETVTLLQRDPLGQKLQVQLPRSGALVRADPDQLREAFLNVFLNAAQAMGGEGGIAVSLASESGFGLVRVHDSGPGIPDAIRERIFEPFFTTKHRGTGLGLPIARRILQAHGGDITVECPATGGTRVTFKLPLEPGGVRA